MTNAWPDKPKPLDVVWCWFPEILAGGIRGPKPRPALVLDVDESRSPIELRVAFGTSKKTNDLFSGEFRISPEDGAGFTASGCDGDTKFDLKRSVWLPYTDDLFSRKSETANRTPVMGRIELSDIELKKRLRAAVEAVGEVKASRPAGLSASRRPK
jgi:hypothetical protein